MWFIHSFTIDCLLISWVRRRSVRSINTHTTMQPCSRYKTSPNQPVKQAVSRTHSHLPFSSISFRVLVNFFLLSAFSLLPSQSLCFLIARRCCLSKRGKGLPAQGLCIVTLHSSCLSTNLLISQPFLALSFQSQLVSIFFVTTVLPTASLPLCCYRTALSVLECQLHLS